MKAKFFGRLSPYWVWCHQDVSCVTSDRAGLRDGRSIPSWSGLLRSVWVVWLAPLVQRCTIFVVQIATAAASWWNHHNDCNVRCDRGASVTTQLDMRHATPSSRARVKPSAAIRIVGLYLIIGCLWIFLSDRLLNYFVPGASLPLTQLQTTKGWLYVVATAALLYGLIRREASINQQAMTTLQSALTELQITQEALKQSEARFRSFMDYSPAAAWITDAEGRVEYLSQVYQRLFQVVPDRAKPSLFDYYPPDLAQTYLDNIKTVAQSGQVLETLEPGMRADGQRGQFLVYKFPLPQANGRQLVGGVAIDVTERERAEQELQAVHDSLNVALTAAAMGTWDLDLVNDTARRSLRHDQIFGYDTLQPEWGQEIAKRHVIPEDQPKFDASFQAALTTGELQLDVRILWSDQSLHWINALGRVYYDGQQRPVRMAGVVMDVSDRKLAETALQRSEEQLRLALEFAQVGCWDWDLLKPHLTWNSHHFHILGLDPETTVASYDNWRDRVHPDDLERVETALQDALRHRTTYESEYRVIYPDGSQHWVFGKGRAMYGASGQPTRMIGILLDSTNRKQTEELLRLREQQFRQTIINAPYPMLVHAEDGEIIHLNHVWSELTGYTVADIPTIADWTEKAYGQRKETVRAAIDQLYALNGRVHDGEFTIQTKDGQHRTWDFSSAPVGQLPDGRRLVLSMAVDITARQQAEMHLRAALAEKDVLLKEIHHRVKNNLQIVSGLLQLQAQGVDDARLVNALRESQNRIESMSLIHKKLYTATDLGHVDVADYIQSLATSLLTTYQIAPGKVALTVAVEPVAISLDQAIPCGLIINELVSNALKYAFPENRSGAIQIHLHRVCDGFELTIQDNGVGLPAHFDWENTASLGLSLVQALATDQLEGTLAVDCHQGTKFTIKFP